MVAFIPRLHTWGLIGCDGAGGLLSTAKDLAQFVAANLELLHSPLLAAMQGTSIPHAYGSMPVGMGWHMRETANKRIIEHHGATGGCLCYVGLVAEEEVAGVVLTNTFRDVDDLALRLLDATWTKDGHYAASCI